MTSIDRISNFSNCFVFSTSTTVFALPLLGLNVTLNFSIVGEAGSRSGVGSFSFQFAFKVIAFSTGFEKSYSSSSNNQLTNVYPSLVGSVGFFSFSPFLIL